MKVAARFVRGSESPSRTDKRRRILKSLGQATEPGPPGGGQAPRAEPGETLEAESKSSRRGCTRPVCSERKARSTLLVSHTQESPSPTGGFAPTE